LSWNCDGKILFALGIEAENPDLQQRDASRCVAARRICSIKPDPLFAVDFSQRKQGGMPKKSIKKINVSLLLNFGL
jgi:hypothetical protein